MLRLRVSNISSRDQFECWLMEMDNAIDKFIDSAPSEFQEKLDDSDESLGVVERWLLSRYSSPKDTRPQSEAVFVDGAARYVGEIFRVRTKSKWLIELDDKKQVFYGIPKLQDGSLKVPFCPLTTVTASTDRQLESMSRPSRRTSAVQTRKPCRCLPTWLDCLHKIGK
jgi:hypothetical protein